MERLSTYKSLWVIEWRKLTATIKRQWAMIIAMVLFLAIPWFTLRNFEEKFATYSWFHLDESVLNFVIYSTAAKLSWVMIIALPCIYYSLFSEETSYLFRKKNKLFFQLITWKLIFFTAIGVFLLGVTWFSTFCMYRYLCWQNDNIIEQDTWSCIGSVFAYFIIRHLSVFPLIIVLFLFLSKKWSYIALVLILIFSALLIFRLPFHFHLNILQPEVNLEWTFQSIMAGCILTIGLSIYYSTVSKKTHVFP